MLIYYFYCSTYPHQYNDELTTKKDRQIKQKDKQKQKTNKTKDGQTDEGK